MTSYTKEKPETIQAMFDHIASRYDRANAIISLGFHKHWNQKLIETVTRDQIPVTFLDLCCGTGEIAFSYLKRVPTRCEAYLIDFSQEMLQCAQEKGRVLGFNSRHSIKYIQADVQKIPLPNESAACATVAYGIRNVKDPKSMISETFRVLKPGGRFGILELTRPKNSILRFGHAIYLRTLLPLLGKWVASDEKAYQYLCRSIHDFISPSEIENQLKATGFVQTTCIPLFGGIATIIYGRKPY